MFKADMGRRVSRGLRGFELIVDEGGQFSLGVVVVEEIDANVVVTCCSGCRRGNAGNLVIFD
jgi:hypothetical protein